ncbi:MAG TPA: pilus assembly protein TadG-related protein [Terracidiphilus sp.]|nr:pilus assembly protein TadG-related protein [Terracidiphilus sp.]
MKEDKAQVLVVVVLSMGVLLGMLALAVDVGQMLFVKRQLQSAADAAALAGALELDTCGSTANCQAMQDAATSAITENGLSTPTLVTQCGSTTSTGLTLTLNNGPCILGTSDPNNGNTKVVEAMVSATQPTLLAGIFGMSSMRLVARSEASVGSSNYNLYVIDPSANQSMLVNGSAKLDVHGGIIVDSNQNNALTVNGGNNTNLSATNIDVVGHVLENGNPNVSPNPNTGANFVDDPFANLAAPTIGSCTNANSSPYYGACGNLSVNAGNSVVFYPGVYNGGININGGAIVTFQPGTYIFNGQMNVNGGATVSGNGVTFYFQSSALQANGGANINLVAPTTGTYAGILYYQAHGDSSSVILNGNSNTVWQGAIYVPSAQLTLNGGSNLAAYTILDVKTLIVDGNNTFTLGDDYSSLPNGSPVGGGGGPVMVQ